MGRWGVPQHQLLFSLLARSINLTVRFVLPFPRRPLVILVSAHPGHLVTHSVNAPSPLDTVPIPLSQNLDDLDMTRFPLQEVKFYPVKIPRDHVLLLPYVPNSLMRDVRNRILVRDYVSAFAGSCVRGPSLSAGSYDAMFPFGRRKFGMRELNFRRRGRIFQFGGLRLFVQAPGFRVLESRWFLGWQRVVLRFVGIELSDSFECH